MTVAMLVLATALLSILGLVSAYLPQRRMPAFDENSIWSAEQLDDAMVTQRKARIVELQRRLTAKNWLAYVLLGMALLMQVAALAADHFAHLAIACISVLPAVFMVGSARASRRKVIQRQLNELCGSGQPVAQGSDKDCSRTAAMKE